MRERGEVSHGVCLAGCSSTCLDGARDGVKCRRRLSASVVQYIQYGGEGRWCCSTVSCVLCPVCILSVGDIK